VVAAVILAGCTDLKAGWQRLAGEPVVPPALISPELPFRYPMSLYVQQVHGDVTLRLHVDSSGLVVPESTAIVTASEHAEFDSSAIEGSARLVFRPARRGERHVGQTVLFPIKFRVPGVPPLPGDSAPTKSRRPNER
jgi:TonB family protein